MAASLKKGRTKPCSLATTDFTHASGTFNRLPYEHEHRSTDRPLRSAHCKPIASAPGLRVPSSGARDPRNSGVADQDGSHLVHLSSGSGHDRLDLFGRFDIVATAQGKIQPAGRVKIVQSLETGKTVTIPVANGTSVKAGDVWVIRLDETQIWAERTALAASFAAYRAEVLRRQAVLAVVRQWRLQDVWEGKAALPSQAFHLPVDIPDKLPQLNNSSIMPSWLAFRLRLTALPLSAKSESRNRPSIEHDPYTKGSRRDLVGAGRHASCAG